MLVKQDIIKEIIFDLMKKLDILVSSALDAKEAATNPESKSENKYDTRGLEASYLAGAQAKRVEELKMLISDFQNIKLRDYTEETPIEGTALLTVEIDSEEQRHFFMVSKSGGMKLNINGQQLYTLSVHSPLGKKFFLKKQFDLVEFEVSGVIKEYEILQVK